MSEPLCWVASTGARSPLGLGSVQVAMCARAKRSEPTETHFLDERGVPIGVCRMMSLPESLHGYRRMLRMASPALCEALPAGVDLRPPLFLALPEAGRADDDPRFDARLLHDLAERSRRPLDLSRSSVVRAGRAGGALAFEAAAAQLASPGGPAAVLVGGVDSYFHRGLLRALDLELRVHSPSTASGFIPAEGAAFVLLSRERTLRGFRPAGTALLGVLNRWEDDDPNVGRALTELVQALCAGGPLGWVLSDLNGEEERLREWMLAEVRALAGATFVHRRFLEEMGDVGAAAGPLLVAMADALFAAGCAPAPEAGVVLGSDGIERGALRLEAA